MSRFIKTPILDRLAHALRHELDSLTLAELIQLDRECKRTTDFNCEASRRMIANHYGSHVSTVIHSHTVRYIRDGEYLSYKEFWTSLNNDFRDPETGKLPLMQDYRKAIAAGNVITAGQSKDNMHNYQITHQLEESQMNQIPKY